MLEEFKKHIEEQLATLILPHHPLFSSLYAGARHTLLAPGKRIRPLLTLATAYLLDEVSWKRGVIPACALEIIHTYSLIHDDLPCMDDDDFRRGLPTLHRLYTEGHAVLVGDYLLTYAFEILAKAPDLTDKEKIHLIELVALRAGGEGMVGGQVMDIEANNQIEEMHARKTGALFCAAVQMGAIIGQASSHLHRQLAEFGRLFGILFQAVDDLLDHDHPQGAQHAEKMVEKVRASLEQLLMTLPKQGGLLRPLTDLVSCQLHS